MSTQLEQKNIIVTGGFGVLGRALGALLVQRGARVALLDRAPVPAGLETNANLFAFGEADLSDAQGAKAAFDAAAGQLGGVDALVNVAGGFSWESIADGSIETWDRMYSMNLRTAVLSAQAAVPHLLTRGAGRIVNVGALASLKAGIGMGAYAASKAGVARLTEALAEELKDHGVTVNAVMPSMIDTPANRADMPDADFTRWVTPAALAAVIAFLLSDDGAPVTGACLPVAGRV
ncbi:MAG: SDR family NAD(P)-dependent oxidoreductase [Pseudomonadota bacterium]